MKTAWRLGLTGAIVLGLVMTVGCSDDDDDDGGGAGTGGGADPTYFAGVQSAALGAANNQADCALCHSIDGSTAGYSGTTMMDIAYRTEFKGGMAPTLLDASNACVTGWMGGTALTATDPAWLSLEAYLQSISDPSVTTPAPLMPEVLADEAAYEAAYAGGDASAGQAKFAAYCGACHGAGTVLGAVPSPPGAAVATRSIGRIAQKVRTSGPPPSGMNDASDTTPGPMPFFEPEELSQADLADIIAYAKTL